MKNLEMFWTGVISQFYFEVLIAAAAQWVRAFAQQEEGWMFESQR